MKDKNTTVQELKNTVAQFIKERNWEQFHTPKNMSMALTVEASELLEHFLWIDDQNTQKHFEKNRIPIEYEVADIFTCLLAFCHENDIDLVQALHKKLELNNKKYPIEKARGNNKKYSQLDS